MHQPISRVAYEAAELEGVIRSLQALSGQVVVEEVLRTLVEVALQHTDADRGWVLLEREGRLTIEAQAAREPGQSRVRLHPGGSVPAEDCRLPRSTLAHAWATGECVVHDDVRAGGWPADEPYFAATRARAVLCMPVRRARTTLALLYLENDAQSGAFPLQRLLLLRLLVGQAAVTLQHAQLLAAEHAARALAERAERRAALLAEINARLGESMRCTRPLGCVAELLVPRLGDWCTVHLGEGTTLVLAGSAHVDGEKRSLLGKMERLFPPRWGARHLAGQVLASGRPLFAPRVDDAFLDSVSTDEEHRQLWRALEDRSLLAVPLLARGQVLGALTLGSGAGRSFAEADLDLALEVGARAGIAADNVQLYRSAEAASRARDEFLTLATNELSTPLSTLVFGAQAMLEPGVQSQPAELVRLAQGTLRQAEKLGRLLRNVVQATLTGSEAPALERQRVDLRDLVLEVVAHFALELQRARCELVLDLEGPVVGQWDRGRLEQVLFNLLSNACRFGAGQPVEIHLQRREDRAYLGVVDHGPGLDPAHQQRLFTRFDRGPGSGPGLGLGLYLCRLAVEAHEGRIGVDSRPGHGASFLVELPGAGPA